MKFRRRHLTLTPVVLELGARRDISAGVGGGARK